MINLLKFLFLLFIIFIIAVSGLVLNLNNILLLFIAIEIAFLSINVIYLIFSIYLDDFFGQITSLLILTVAAAESAVGLAILVAFYKNTNKLLLDSFVLFKG